MAKKKLSNEQKLKRQVEILKAQVKASSGSGPRTSFDYVVGKGVEKQDTRLNYSEGAVVKNIDYDPRKNVTLGAVRPEAKTVKKESYDLPITKIKRDLGKTALYALFSLGLIAVLHLSGLDLVRFIR